jgi:CheY-like chemotaxis protein
VRNVPLAGRDAAALAGPGRNALFTPSVRARSATPGKQTPVNELEGKERKNKLMSYAYVIDDNRETADSLCQWLSLFDYDTQVALGPLAAIEALARRVPDVIFLDIHMQGMDGVEVCRYIRRDPRTAEVAIIGMSSDTQSTLVERVRMAGANGFLGKPLELDALEDVLKAVEKLNEARHRPAPAARPGLSHLRPAH